MELRRIQLADVPSFLALWRRVYAEGEFLASPPPPESRISPIIERVMREKIPVFVMCEHDTLVGEVEVFPGSLCGQKGKDADKTGYVGIQIDARHRGKSVGSELMRVAIADSLRYGYDALALSVYESNLRAVRLYDRLGFTTVEESEPVCTPSGIETREKKMVLHLNPM